MSKLFNAFYEDLQSADKRELRSLVDKYRVMMSDNVVRLSLADAAAAVRSAWKKIHPKASWPLTGEYSGVENE